VRGYSADREMGLRGFPKSNKEAFFVEKRTKKLLPVSAASELTSEHGRARKNKSFLVLFFKKELLPSCNFHSRPDELPLWPTLIHPTPDPAPDPLDRRGGDDDEIFSGWQIYNAAPIFPFSFPWALGGWLAAGIAWHIAAMWVLIADGLVYLVWDLPVDISGVISRRHRRPRWGTTWRRR